MKFLIALLKAMGLVFFSTIISILIAYGVYKNPILTTILLLIALIIIATITFMN